eukprot:3640587-Amphidinium_carterae.1
MDKPADACAGQLQTSEAIAAEAAAFTVHLSVDSRDFGFVNLSHRHDHAEWQVRLALHDPLPESGSDAFCNCHVKAARWTKD